MNFELNRFYRAKALGFIFLCYAGFALLGMSLVFLSHGNYEVVTFIAILFLAGPLVTAYVLKNRFLRPVSVEIADSFLEIREEAQEALVIRWATVASYQVELTRVFFNSGYTLRLIHHDGSKTNVILIEPVFAGENISEGSTLYHLSRSIKRFNRSAARPVGLRPNLFASRPGTILITLLGVLVLLAVSLFLLKGRRVSSANIFGLTMIVVILAAGVAGRKKAGDKIFRQLQEIQEE